jgi:hypothetical protein
MAHRAGRRNSSVRTVLEEAEQNLLSAFRKSSMTRHKGLKGDSRARSLADFLEKRLPAGYGVYCKVEVVDYMDQRSNEMDIVIIDKIRNSLLSDYPLWVPAESLLAYIEVKSVLTRSQLRKSYAAAESVKSLRPFGRSFTLTSDNINDAPSDASTATKKKNAEPKPLRCFRTIFAYRSDLTERDWLMKEWGRVIEVTSDLQCPLNVIDRILVLNRGMINPPAKTGTDIAAKSSLFQQWFINLVNFLIRENGRRPAFDLQSYSGTTFPGWKALQYPLKSPVG